MRVSRTKILDWFVVALVGIAAIALHLRLALLVGALWRDETNSVNLANVSTFSEFWHFLEFDSFPALFFALLRLWTAIFGAQNDDALRALGFLVGLGILVALWLNARAFGVRLPILSFALVGLNPMIIRYGDSIRAYGLGILLILLTLRSFWRLVETNGFPSGKRIGVALLCALLSVHCLYYNSVLLLAIALGASVVAARRRDWKCVALIFGLGFVAALSLLVYLPVMMRMREWNFLVHHPTGFGALWERAGTVVGSPLHVITWLWVALIFAGLLLALVRQKLSPPILFAAVTMLTGLVGYICFLHLLGYYTQPWYYIALAVFVACLLDIIFGSWPKTKLVGPIIALGLLCFAAPPAWSEMKHRHTNADLIAARLEGISKEGDVVLLPRWECAISFVRYYHGPAEVVTVPLVSDHRFHSYDLIIAQMKTPDAHLPVLAKIEEALRSGHRVFIAGELKMPDSNATRTVLRPFYRDENGLPHGSGYYAAWQLYVGQFVGTHAAKVSGIPHRLSGYEDVLEYEKLALSVAEGWRD